MRKQRDFPNVIFLLAFLTACQTCLGAQLDCIKPPTQNSAIDASISIAFGRLGSVKAGEFSLGFKRSTDDILSRFQSERVYIFSTLEYSVCDALNKDPSIVPAERATLRAKYSTQNYTTIFGQPSSAASFAVPPQPIGYPRPSATSMSVDRTSAKDMALRGDDFYYGHRNTKLNYTEAVRLYRFAAARGDPHGEYRLGQIYSGFDGAVSRSEDEARKWFSRAAAHGEADGLAGLGLLYLFGSDDVRAVQFFTAAAARGSPEGERRLGDSHMSGIGGQVQDQREALKWYLLAAAQGDADACISIGLIYAKGQAGVARNEAEAESWFGKAWLNDKGSDGESSLGWAYEDGHDSLPKSDNDALRWYMSGATKEGHSVSKFSLGRMYEAGRGGLKSSDAMAVQWYLKAAIQDGISAQVALAKIYETGRPGVSRNESEAIKWYRRAAQQGAPEAQERLVTRGLSW